MCAATAYVESARSGSGLAFQDLQAGDLQEPLPKHGSATNAVASSFGKFAAVFLVLGHWPTTPAPLYMAADYLIGPKLGEGSSPSVIPNMDSLCRLHSQFLQRCLKDDRIRLFSAHLCKA